MNKFLFILSHTCLNIMSDKIDERIHMIENDHTMTAQLWNCCASSRNIIVMTQLKIIDHHPSFIPNHLDLVLENNSRKITMCNPPS